MMNRFAYRTTGFAIKALSSIARARINIFGEENIPKGPTIFVINHFTRIETFLLPYQIFKLTGVPVWSLAAPGLFVGSFGEFLEKMGAVSTKDPDRDRLIVKSLLTGEASWIIFPEGRMVKNKKIVEKGRFMISYAGGKHPPHTGAATLALRTEFYRERISKLALTSHEKAQRLLSMFNLDAIDQISTEHVNIVPVNLTYYPVRARENILSKIAGRMVDGITDRVMEEIMTEGPMLLSGVDIDLRFGAPITVDHCMSCGPIKKDIHSKKEFSFDDLIPSRKRLKREALKIMQKYMHQIYSMTTVNHDHLMGSLLKKSPVSRINVQNLKRRLFLAATQNNGRHNVYFHQSMDREQTHILTDDSFGKVEEFLTFASEKGAIKRDGHSIFKDASRLATVFDFHRARIDNPVAVIANEVEPLDLLQKKISRLSWQPEFLLKKKIKQYFLKRAEKEFEQDYEAYFQEGETKQKTVGKPFLIKGRSKKLGVVLAHGYMAAPLEVKGLAAYLGKKGYWVYAPRLKGHGTSPEDLAHRSYEEWLESVEQGYVIMSQICKKVVVGGFSTGAGLALDLAARLEAVTGVFAVSTPLRLQDLASKFAPAVDVWNRIMEKVRLEDAKKEFVENNPENPHINYFKNPISGIRELEKLMDALEPKLPDIKAPALIIQSQEDPVVNPKGSEKIFRQLGSEDKQLVLFNFNRHGILLGEGSQRVYRSIGNFIDYLKTVI